MYTVCFSNTQKAGVFVKKSKNKKWYRFRHKVVFAVLRIFFGPYVRLRYGIRIEKFRQQGKRPYLVLMNHQTGFDQFFVGLAFSGPVYYLATEDIFSMGWLSSVIRFLVNPIPIKKQTADLKAVMNCIRVGREGHTIVIAPEGNRTYHGRTVYIKPSIISLARKLSMPIALFRIEGGYGIQPRWSDVVRRGKMRGFVSQVIEPEEYKQMSEQALYDRVCQGLYVDEAHGSAQFRHKKLAEYLERAIYVCPNCGLSAFESHKDLITCKKCGLQARHLPDTRLTGVPFEYVAQWYDYQCDYVNRLDLQGLTDKPVYEEQGQMSRVIVCSHKELMHKCVSIRLYGDRIQLLPPAGETYDLPFAETDAVCVLGKNKINIYYGENVYQICGDKRFNALKYVNFFHRYNNIIKGEENGEFLGL